MHRDTSGLLKRIAIWGGATLLTPVVLFMLVAALFYVPPVQRWVVGQVTEVVSEKTGMDISVEYVRLQWPLDLGIDGFLMVNQGDTIADVKHLVADVRLRPLLKKRIVISGLKLAEARIDTDGLISDLQVKGEVEELSLASRGIDLDQQTIEVNGARLSGARLHIALSDTAAADTTQSVITWRVNADSLSIFHTDVTVSLPGDSTHIRAYMGQTVARQAYIDLEQKTYQVESFNWHDGELDFAPFALSGITLVTDSIYYGPKGTRFSIRQAAMKEKGGLELTHLSTAVSLDTAFSHIELPHLVLQTTDSGIEGSANLDFNVADSINPGTMDVSLNAGIGKQDIIRLYTLLGTDDKGKAQRLPQQLIQRYPTHPLEIRGNVSGNLKHMRLTGVNLSLPTAIKAQAEGYLANIDHTERMQGKVALSIETGNLSFLTSVIPALADGSIAIPSGIKVKGVVGADGPTYTADLNATQGKGTVKVKGHFDRKATTYSMDASIRELNLHNFMPHDSLYTLTANVSMKGTGTDLLHTGNSLKADAEISHLQYGQLAIDSLTAKATLQKGHATATVTGRNQLFDGTIGIDGLLSRQLVDGKVSTSLAKADLQGLGLSKKPLTVGMSGDITIKSNLKDVHEVKGLIENIYIRDRRNNYHSEPVGLLLRTNRDTTLVRLQSGTFIVKADASGGYERVLKQLNVLKDSMMAQYQNKVIDQPAIKRLLPTGRVYLTCGRNNPMADILHTKGIDYKELLIDINLSPQTGINGESHLYALNYDSILIDTIGLRLKQKGDRLTYNGQVTNNRRNPQFVFNSLFDGHIHQYGALIGVRYFDKENKMGIRLGATAEMESGGIRVKLMPERPTIGYKEFNLNKDNFIFFSSNNHIEAKVDLIADDRTGVKIYTIKKEEAEDQDPLDLTVSLNSFNLDEFTSVLPYVPRLTGLLGGDLHIVQDDKGRFSVVSDLNVEQMTYENSPIGNLSAELNYLQREGDSHAVEALLMLDGKEVGLLSGSYTTGTKQVDAKLTLTRTPLSIANGFIPDQLIGFDGYAEGSVNIKGTTDKPHVDGEVYLDSAYLVSIPYGVRLRFDNDPVRIEDSRLLLENFGLYAAGKEPLVMMGNVDFSNTSNINMDLRMRARDFQVINAKQTARSVAYGKAFINLYARMQGPLDQLNLRGRVDVLNTTDMTYMLLDSPLSTDNRLDELVKFTDFNDTTQVVITRPKPNGLNADLTVSVAEGTRIVCHLNAEQSNYVDLTGSSDLRLRYSNSDISLTGRYTVSNGQMKYSLPIIPLKTFSIKDGSYVEFTGDPTNPRLNITATERTKATVGGAEGQVRSVTFDCGVVITKTLNDMGLQFIISAPEDMTVNSELQSMSAEERGKLAVTMLTTGMYLADGNTSGFSMNSVLSAYLQNEINNITGSALKTLDLSVGLDNTTDASGQSHTDYSFKFSKRLFDNRLKIQLGGKVSSGVSEMPGQQQSFFDNVTMEYRLDKNAQKSIKLFYQQNVYDWLDGYTGLYGVGYVWRKKMDSLWDIFKMFNKEKPVQPMIMRPENEQRDSAPKDSLRHEQK